MITFYVFSLMVSLVALIVTKLVFFYDKKPSYLSLAVLSLIPVIQVFAAITAILCWFYPQLRDSISRVLDRL